MPFLQIACESRRKIIEAMETVMKAWRGWRSGNSSSRIRRGRKKSSTVVKEQEKYEEAVRDLVGSRGSVEMQMVALIGVFAASGLVPAEEAAFTAAVTAYAMLLSWTALPAYPEGAAAAAAAAAEEEEAAADRKVYVGIGLALGLFLPLGLAVGGFSRGNPAVAAAGAPHLFLYSAQLLSELAMSRHPSRFCAPLRLIVSLLYAARRQYALAHWLRVAFAVPLLRQDDLWILFERCLVVANILYCNIHIFGIVIPRLLLRAFERYIVAKNAHYASSQREPMVDASSSDGIEREN